ncbi:hypothetical protein QFZ82_007573 [Streptomyces sp. V4I23]|nr:hypothetical protein [Streptomyces sp. V4I23]
MTPGRLAALIMTITETSAAALLGWASLLQTAAESPAGVGHALRAACSGRAGGMA